MKILIVILAYLFYTAVIYLIAYQDGRYDGIAFMEERERERSIRRALEEQEMRKRREYFKEFDIKVIGGEEDAESEES